MLAGAQRAPQGGSCLTTCSAAPGFWPFSSLLHGNPSAVYWGIGGAGGFSRFLLLSKTVTGTGYPVKILQKGENPVAFQRYWCQPQASRLVKGGCIFKSDHNFL